MNIQQIEGKTHDLSKPKDWDDTKGECASLPIRAENNELGIVMVSEWKPTPQELRRLIAGASVFLEVVGTSHPPVMLKVGEP